MDFVASHIHLVESLRDFPSLIGKQLFDLTRKHGMFFDDDRQIKAAQLFCNAYKEEVLCELNLHGSYLAVNQCLHVLLEFHHLVKLDVSDCDLGDDHQYLLHIGGMPCLECLKLRENHLSDIGIQKLTTKLRVFGTGPSKLKYLDLSGNPKLTDRCVIYLFIFKMLDFLDLSASKLTCEGGISKLERNTTLRRVKIQNRIADEVKVETCGWAEALMAEWIMMYTQHKTVKTKNPYKKYKIMKVDHNSMEISQQDKVNDFPVIQFASRNHPLFDDEIDVTDVSKCHDKKLDRLRLRGRNSKMRRNTSKAMLSGDVDIADLILHPSSDMKDSMGNLCGHSGMKLVDGTSSDRKMNEELSDEEMNLLHSYLVPANKSQKL
ncbi:leucine-rich repeat-containing protein 42-like [Ptychodera flava]|uniref:leucine-rich repeat-containing protein 42-like n=1 Tax=Ptychodera flava TaxID=63121 RepID=UPI00396A0263